MSRDAKNLPTIPPPSLRLPLPRQGVLIEHRANGSVITQNPTNGYINATTLCKKAGKMFGHYFANASTKEFLEELSIDIGIPITVENQRVPPHPAEIRCVIQTINRRAIFAPG